MRHLQHSSGTDKTNRDNRNYKMTRIFGRIFWTDSLDGFLDGFPDGNPNNELGTKFVWMQLFCLQLEAFLLTIGVFLLTVEYFSFFTYNWSVFCLQF